ncbi:hypothetical protein PHYSODRAFT_343229 [Phytophthora sojae]|uniref:Uncharacterized protein n=1 Tax=Phytophthora sojae (strain P6497) TaxID=1094619 RepID=G5AJ18_PHYSP|nr:hypothetical protein PHYSODRAFT_343229 [Phytophthora sojae]EGZ04480.1 hypothetical protein PHYSODRAFT_343229 [Phytophthora sojae]|eukprot:XP_009540069.1 hypothetical protein PHYSODRAFT_343229 [Phytophthora sojae]
MSDADCNAGQASDGGAPERATEQLPDAPPAGGGASGSAGEQGDRGATSGHADTQDARQASFDEHQDDANTPDDAASKSKALVVKTAGTDTPPHANKDADAADRKGNGDTEGKVKDAAGSTATAAGRTGAFAGTSCASRSASAERLPDSGKGAFGLSLQDSCSRAAQSSNPELAGQSPPARFAVSSDLNLTFLQGVFPAHGFGGIEALWTVESLTDKEIQELIDLLDPGMELHRSVLRLRSSDTGRSISELHGLLDSIAAKRELASLLQCYDLDGLARRVFGTTSLDSELQKAKRDIAVLNRCWEETLEVATKKREQEIKDHDRDFKRAAQEHERQEQALQLQIDKLSRENDDLRSTVRTMTSRLKAGSMNVGRTMNFLNRHNTRVDGNWPRLKALLECAKDNKLPPDGWATQILVNAVDDFGAQPGAYVFVDDGDDDQEEKDDDGPGAREGSKDAPLDFTQDSSAPSTTSSLKSRSVKTSRAPKSATGRHFQLRPEVYTPNELDAMDPLTPYARSVEDARASLVAHAVIWDKLRLDVQLAMQSGLDYLDAFDLVCGDNVVHPRFHVRDLLELLVRIMYWRKLDQTPWTSYVPSWYYKKAETRLEQLTYIPDKWPALKSVRLDEEAEVMQAMYSEVCDDIDDETQDETFRTTKPFKAKLDLRTTPPREAKRRNSTSSTTSSTTGSLHPDPEVAPPPAKRPRAA